MIKKLVTWLSQKKEANIEPFYKTREVWSYTYIDPETKHISTRPVLIFRKAGEGMFWGLLLTKTRVRGKTIYIPRLKNGKKVSPLSQMRTLKATRLVRKLGTAGEKEFGTVNNSILRLLLQSEPAQKPRVVVADTLPSRRKKLPNAYSQPVYVFTNPYTLAPRG